MSVAETGKDIQPATNKRATTDREQHLFLNLGCAPFICSTSSIYARALPSLSMPWFATYIDHLIKQRPDIATLTIPQLLGKKLVSSDAYIRAFLLHHLPLVEANSLYIATKNDYSILYKAIPDNQPYSLALRLTALAKSLKEAANNPATPVWLNAHPSLIQFFGPSITLNSNNAGQWGYYSIDSVGDIIEKMPDILNEDDFFPETHTTLDNAVDHFYAYSPARWLFLLTQVVGTALYSKLKGRSVQEMSGFIKRAIQSAPWPNQPDFAQFESTQQASEIWSHALHICKNFPQVSLPSEVLLPPQKPLVLKKGRTPTKASTQGLRALLFWKTIQTMANNIKKHGHTAVSYQEVADLFEAHGLAFHTQEAIDAPAPLKQLCAETFDGKCTLPQEMELLVVTNPRKKRQPLNTV